MSNLSERCEQRKTEAQSIADRFNSVKSEIEKLRGEANKKEKENAILYEQFIIKNGQYAELVELIKEEEGVKS